MAQKVHFFLQRKYGCLLGDIKLPVHLYRYLVLIFVARF
jgi:hypothetical protein